LSPQRVIPDIAKILGLKKFKGIPVPRRVPEELSPLTSDITESLQDFPIH
jgi:hypothetical protein